MKGGVLFSSVNSVSLNNRFTGRESFSPADKFLSDSDKIAQANQKGDFFARNMWSGTAIYSAGAGLLGYEVYNYHKFSKLKKAEKFLQANLLKQSFLKKFALLVPTAIAFVAGLQYLFNQNSDKKYDEIKTLFNKINTATCATIEDKSFRASTLGASFNPISGKISINQNLINDPLTRRKCEKLLKHELVHARQYETIARMDNGIEKLNYATMKRIAKFAQNPYVKNEFISIYHDIQNNPLKYDNKVISLNNAPVNFKNYITAIHTLITNKNANYNDIPMIIDKSYYENVRKQKDKLTPEEKQKAELYYQAQIDYPQLTVFQLLNPFSKYRDNLLEVEAYKENPGFYGFIRKLFGKP